MALFYHGEGDEDHSQTNILVMDLKVSWEIWPSSPLKNVSLDQWKVRSLASYVIMLLAVILKSSYTHSLESAKANDSKKLIRIRRFQSHQHGSSRLSASFLPSSFHIALGQSDLHCKWPNVISLLDLRTSHVQGNEMFKMQILG